MLRNWRKSLKSHTQTGSENDFVALGGGGVAPKQLGHACRPVTVLCMGRNEPISLLEIAPGLRPAPLLVGDAPPLERRSGHQVDCWLCPALQLGEECVSALRFASSKCIERFPQHRIRDLLAHARGLCREALRFRLPFFIARLDGYRLALDRLKLAVNAPAIILRLPPGGLENLRGLLLACRQGLLMRLDRSDLLNPSHGCATGPCGYGLTDGCRGLRILVPPRERLHVQGQSAAHQRGLYE